MIELSAKVNLGGLGFRDLTNILITVKKLILLIMSLCAPQAAKTFSEEVSQNISIHEASGRRLL
jgi:hypothetical protein